MRLHTCRLLTVAAVLTIAGGCTGDRDALRRIVQEQCVPHWLAQHEPAPCVFVTTRSSENGAKGVAVLHDRKGGAHFLLIPVDTITGIESAELAAPSAENYFADAWQAREFVADESGRRIPRNAIGLAVNPRTARSQDQLHIHMECLRPQVYAALRSNAERIRESWSPLIVDGWRYQAMRVMGEKLRRNPFALLANNLPEDEAPLGTYTLLVAAMDFQNGPGFILLAGTGVPNGESLLDSSCAVARR